MLTLNQLKNFLLLAEILHFAKTAERLGITQAALSRDIKKLENEIACQLFDRSDKWNISLRYRSGRRAQSTPSRQTARARWPKKPPPGTGKNIRGRSAAMRA